MASVFEESFVFFTPVSTKGDSHTIYIRTLLSTFYPFY